MSNTIIDIEGIGLDDIFPPMPTDLVHQIVGEHASHARRIAQMSAVLDSQGMTATLQYFIDGNIRDGRAHIYVRDILDASKAMKALDADFWNRALQKTDVLDLMPKKRRDEWSEQIRNHKAPEFTEESVRATLADMLSSRALFLAERVEGIFRGLSHEHVTNRPEAFSTRMILRRVVDEYGFTAGETDYIHDLRCVIAKFMGRDEPSSGSSREAVKDAYDDTGQWLTLDGGALRLRVYKKGTGHLEVHPDMAWRLNAILASLHPAAIPEQHRRPPSKKQKQVELMTNLLPFQVLQILRSMRPAYVRVEDNTQPRGFRTEQIENALQLDGFIQDKHIKAKVEAVLGALGGVHHDNVFRFDYPPGKVIKEVCRVGGIPDQYSHQFYPTPSDLADYAAALLDLDDEDKLLDVDAGIGALADAAWRVHTVNFYATCIEVSAIMCAVLRSKGYSTLCEDFLAWAQSTWLTWDAVIMNPPFDQGRWQSHLDAAWKLVAPGGNLVAILPSGAKQKVESKGGLANSSVEWHGPYHNRFPGASVSVVILKATRLHA